MLEGIIGIERVFETNNMLRSLIIMFLQFCRKEATG